MHKNFTCSLFALLLAVSVSANSWEQVGGNGINGSWPNGSRFFPWALCSCGTNDLYVGGPRINPDITMSSEVWVLHGVSNPTWTLVGARGVNGFPSDNFDQVTSMACSMGNLYVRTINGSALNPRRGKVLKYDGVRWVALTNDIIPGPGMSADIEFPTPIAKWRSYIVSGDNTSGTIWRENPSSGTWNMIGGTGYLGSWNEPVYIRSLHTIGETLFAGISRCDGSCRAELWSFDGRQWQLVEASISTSPWGDFYSEIPYLANHRGQICTAFGNNYDVWEKGSEWVQVAGDGVNGSWSDETMSIQNMTACESIYVGTSSPPTVWKCDGSCTQIGGDGIDGSWTAGSVSDSTHGAAFHQGNLYVGRHYNNTMGISIDEVWRYIEPPQVDSDLDLIPDTCDNCPVNQNDAQRDTDGDGVGDVCDPCEFVADRETENVKVTYDESNSSVAITWTNSIGFDGVRNYSVIDGDLESLHADRGFFRARCIGQVLDASISDAPIVNTYYLIRAGGMCGKGTYGSSFGGPVDYRDYLDELVTDPCP